jgi:MFS family permease
MSDRGSASGLYLASYFFGGLIGSAVLGLLFDMFGWTACVGGIAVALLVAALLAIFLKTPMTPEAPAR